MVVSFDSYQPNNMFKMFVFFLPPFFFFPGSINFLHADCDKFRHPLLHIQKTPADCPVIAIDSFRHMYVFPDFKDVK